MTKSEKNKAELARLLKEAEESGFQNDWYFATTFDRYQTQVKILENLREVIESEGTLVTKEYVRGRENVYTHPAIGEFNKTSTAANGTVITLINILKNKRDEPKGGKLDEFLESDS